MTCQPIEQLPRVFRRGLSWAQLITVRDVMGALKDLTGASIEVEFTTQPGVTPFLSLAVGSGVTLRPDQSGTGKGLAEVHATPAQTMLWPLGLNYWSIVVWPPGQERDEIAFGTVMVWPPINTP